MVKYHGDGIDKHLLLLGQERIRCFWETVVEKMWLVNMWATAAKYAILSNKKVLVSYDQAKFESQKSPKGGIISDHNSFRTMGQKR